MSAGAGPTLILGSGVERISGPGGSAIYLLNERPLLARSPAKSLEEAREFLACADIRIDLRSPDKSAFDQDEVGPHWPVIRIPVTPLGEPGSGSDRREIYRQHQDELRQAAEIVEHMIQEGKIPLIHCQAGADRTGIVCALVLEKYVGAGAAEEDFADASAQAGSPRVADSIRFLLNSEN